MKRSHLPERQKVRSHEMLGNIEVSCFPAGSDAETGNKCGTFRPAQRIEDQARGVGVFFETVAEGPGGQKSGRGFPLGGLPRRIVARKRAENFSGLKKGFEPQEMNYG